MKRKLRFAPLLDAASESGGGTGVEVAVERIDPGISERACAGERKRIREIDALCRKHAVSEETRTKLIDDECTVERASAVILDEIAGRRSPAVEHVEVGADRGDAMVRAMEDALCVRSPHCRIDDPKRREAAEEFRGIGMRAIAEILIEREMGGGRLPVELRRADRLFERAVSTVSFPALLSNVMHKFLVTSYQSIPNTAKRLTAKRSVNDFKDMKDVEVGQFSTLVDISGGNPIPYGGMQERSATYGTKTYGRAFGVTREMFVNDDLGALLQAPQFLGAASARSENKRFIDLLTSNSGVGPTMAEDTLAMFTLTNGNAALFHASGANYLDGATSALGVSAMELGITALSQVKGVPDLEGVADPLNIQPRFVLTPSALKFKAAQLLQSQVLNIGTGSDTTLREGNVNVFYNVAEPISDPLLDGKTNGTTAWYLFGDPSIPGQAAFVTAYLFGNEEPVIERRDPQDSLGIGWIVYHDAKVSAVNHRGVVRFKGTT